MGQILNKSAKVITISKDINERSCYFVAASEDKDSVILIQHTRDKPIPKNALWRIQWKNGSTSEYSIKRALLGLCSDRFYLWSIYNTVLAYQDSCGRLEACQMSWPVVPIVGEWRLGGGTETYIDQDRLFLNIGEHWFLCPDTSKMRVSISKKYQLFWWLVKVVEDEMKEEGFRSRVDQGLQVGMMNIYGNTSSSSGWDGVGGGGPPSCIINTGQNTNDSGYQKNGDIRVDISIGNNRDNFILFNDK